ncbi:MAG: metallophosphoesterase [Solirubrobacterales bacterium]
MPGPDAQPETRPIRVAAAGDVHCREGNREEVVAAFAALESDTDLVLLAGDLTSHGTVAEAEIVVAAAAETEAPVFAVLGNHDWHAGLGADIAEVLRGGGITVLAGEEAVRECAGVEVGIVGAKGFVGGFAPHQMPDFGEPSLRALYAEAGAEIEALAGGLAAIATCALRLVVLHYSPSTETLAGEPPEIWAFMGSDRLAAPILEHGPDLVVHGHAHAGSPEGRIGETPVYNVSVPVLGADFRRFELQPSAVGGPIP